MSSARVFTENEGESALVGISLFDRLDAADASDLLRPCCASRRWVAEVVSGRPYASMRRLVSASDDILADLGWSDIASALAAQPRTGDLIGAGGWEADEAVAGQLGAGKLAYEARFGHPFLICATGRSTAAILAALQQRLTNSTEVEREVVCEELRAVVRLRLIKTFR